MLRIRRLLYFQMRAKGSRRVEKTFQQRKKTTSDRALDNFDDFYGSVFGVRWKNMRAALLSEHKYIALVNNFGDTEKTCSLLEMDGAISVKSLIQLAKERLESELALERNLPKFKLSERLGEVIRRYEEREKQALYPDAAAGAADRLQFQSDAKATDATPAATPASATTTASGSASGNATPVDAKKSLDSALKENSQLDPSRLINPQYGMGGLHDFVPANRIKGMEDWVPESDHYKYYQTENTDFPLQVELEQEFTFPENLFLYTYEKGNCAEFKSPKKCLTGVLSHYLMDGASVLPPLILDIKHGERVLDACAAPGGKSLLMLQTLHPEQLICNDIQESRLNRIRKVMHEYLFDFKERWEGKRIILIQSDARNLDAYESFDKILVDVPCTTDRHSLNTNDNNIFKSTRVKERLRIPELQAGILTNCLRLLRPGGSLVYSTCSLSPVQNDGVVHMALQRAFSEFGITATIKDLSLIIELFSDIYRFEDPKGLRYGQMVVPFLPANFGPMYFSKITRDM